MTPLRYNPNRPIGEQLYTHDNSPSFPLDMSTRDATYSGTYQSFVPLQTRAGIVTLGFAKGIETRVCGGEPIPFAYFHVQLNRERLRQIPARQLATGFDLTALEQTIKDIDGLADRTIHQPLCCVLF